MKSVGTKKSSLKLVHGHHDVKVVTNHRLAEGMHSTVFPQHAEGWGGWHSGSRNGHGGSHTSPSRKSK